MGGWLSRTTIVENSTDAELEIRECPDNSRPLTVLKLRPGKQKAIRANKFHQNSIDSYTPRSIQVFIHTPGVPERLGCLITPQEFKDNARIRLRFEDQILVPMFFNQSNFRRIKVFQMVQKAVSKTKFGAEGEF